MYSEYLRGSESDCWRLNGHWSIWDSVPVGQQIRGAVIQRQIGRMSLPLRRGISMEHTGYLGNSRVILDNHFDAATQADIQHMALNYESEDEVMSRLHARKQRRYAATTSSSNSSTASTTKARYSRQDILEQYCITERSMDDGFVGGAGDGSGGFFSCLSSHQPSPCTTRGAGSILTVCVRTQQKAPSDENLFDLYRRRLPPPPRALTHQYAHYSHQARYPWGPPPDEICHYDKNLHSSYFRQYVPSGDPSRYTWMPSDDESVVRMERPRSILDQTHHQAFLIQREREREYQRQRERAEVARLGGMGVSVVGVGGSGVGTVIMTRPEGIPSPPPPAQMRPKHVSFARSHTLTSFDDAVVCLDSGSTSAPSSSTGMIPPVLAQQQRSTLPSSTQLMNRFSRSQERLIITRPSYEAITRQPEPMAENIIMLEQRKRASMKTQATQTEACLGRKPLPYSQLHLSPRTVHRVKMVSQGAQTNGITINGRKLTKSYSEVGSKFAPPPPLEITAPGTISEAVTAVKHEPLQRTQSDEPPRSPFLSLSPPPSATLALPSSGVEQQPTIPSDTSSVTRSEHDSEESETKNEILIDFKPQMPHTQKELLKKPLMKTSSDGDMLLDQRRVARRDLDEMLVPELPKASLSHEFIAMQDDEFDISAYAPFFQNVPIRHEGIYRDLEEHVFSSIDESIESNGGLHMLDSIDDEFHENIIYRGRYRSTTSEPDSNGVRKSRYDDECIVPTSSSFPERRASPFASTDSLSIDIRDQSEDGIWNESQSTVLQVDSCTENGAALSSSEITSLPLSPSVNVLTPSSRRKHLLMMQHQQRSSIDTEALDEELGDQFQQIPSTISSPRLALEIPSISIKPSADSSTTSKQVHYKTMKKQREGMRKIHLPSLEAHLPSPGDAQVPSSATEPSPVAVVPDLHLARTDSGKTNTDMSESTTTDDYITANSTDSSRKSVSTKSLLVDTYSTTSTVPTTTSSSTPFTTQPPTAADSFDSVASSIYSTIRGDYLDEMVVPSYSPPPILEEASDVTSSSPVTKVTISDKVTLIGERPSSKEMKVMHVHASSTRSGRSSPTGSSSSSGSYSLQGSYADVAGLVERERSKKSNGSPRPGTSSGRRSSAGVKSTRAAAMKSRMGASVSEDERSAHYSSSGYYDSPMDEDLTWKSPKHDQRKLKPSPDKDRKRPYTLDVAGPSKSALRKDDHLHQLTPTDKAKTLPRSKKTTPSSLSPSRGDREGLRVTGDKKRTKTRTRSPMQNHRKQIRQSQRSPQLTKSEDASPIDDTRATPSHLLTSDDSSAGPPLSLTTATITTLPSHQQLSPRKTKKFRDYNRRKAAQAAAAAAAAATPVAGPGAAGVGGISPRSPIIGKPRKRAGSIDEKAGASGNGGALLAMRRKSLHARIEFEEPEETLRKERERDVAKRKSPVISPTKQHTLPTTSKSPTRGATPPSVGSIAPTDLQRLKAASAESLRSVSPGSDSVFYSDLSSHAAISSASITTAGEKHVHCLHCGKEVDIVDDVMEKCTGAPQPDIVQPPAGFADSPREKQPPLSGGRLYKKLEKRFRSEERSFTDRRIHRYKPDVRAKSEEREKPDTAKSKLRPMARSTDSSVEGLRAVDSSPCVLPADEDEDGDVGIYGIPYINGDWIYIDDFEEMHTWSSPTSEDDHHRREARTSIDSTESEHEFKKRFQAVTHRMVHRKSCLEMYKRQASKSFAPESTTGEHESLRKCLEEVLKLMLVIWCRENEALKILTSEKNESDKTVVVRRHSGEFGFRIHGSKPVVVSAIEPDTPAESSGLEIGDIVLAVNGVSVLDKSHSEVVKIAHAGSDTLILEVARTCGVLSPASADVHGGAPLYSGYLWKIGGLASGHPTNKWIRRWFSIKADNCLYYYKTDIDKQPVGAMMLSNYDVTQVPDADPDAPERSFRFTICRKGVLPLHLAADSEHALIRWMEVIDQAIKDSDLADTWLEQARRNLTVPPCSIQKPDCFGYLIKLGTQWKSWSRRYCVLKDACLYFYNDAHAKSAFGVACLHGYKVQQSTSGSKKHAFEVIPADPTQKHYYFHTESDMDRKRWLAALEYSIDRWLKVG